MAGIRYLRQPITSFASHTEEDMNEVNTLNNKHEATFNGWHSSSYRSFFGGRCDNIKSQTSCLCKAAKCSRRLNVVNEVEFVVIAITRSRRLES